MSAYFESFQAAHCFVSQNFEAQMQEPEADLSLVSLDAISVIIGSTQNSVFQSRGRSMQRFRTEKIFVFPGFQMKRVFDDLAILQLEINSTATIQEFIMLPREKNLPWERCFAAGWGLIDNQRTRFL